VTVIATGFTKPEDKRESVVEPKPASEFFSERAPETAHAAPVPEPMPATAAQVFEEELDVPAYLRQGKMLN
jgi:hypothetical protein